MGSPDLAGEEVMIYNNIWDRSLNMTSSLETHAE